MGRDYEEIMAERKKKAKFRVGMATAGIVVLVGLIAGASCIEKVSPGYVGVVYTPSTGTLEDTLNQGWHLVSPLKKVTGFSVATEQLYLSQDEREGSKDNDSFDARTSDGKVNVDFEMSYSFDREKIGALFTKYRGLSGDEIMKTIVRGKIKTYVNEVTSRYTVLQVHLEKKTEVNAEVLAHLQDKLSEFGVLVESANLIETRVDPTIEQAIVERGKANQELEAEKQKTLKAEEEAKRMKVEAEAKAEVKRIEAEAQALENQKIEQTLTAEMIQKMMIEKWDGKLSVIQAGDSGTILNIPGSAIGQ